MPERIFSYYTRDELKDIVKSLVQALTTGSTQELRNSSTGFSVVTGPITQNEIRTRLTEARYEIYLKGLAGDAVAADLEPTDPFQEKVMRVETTYAPPYFLTSPYGA